jgi:hypothetical protein
VEVIAGATIWGLFCCFLLFPQLGLPALLHRAATVLLAAEFVLVLGWRYGTEGCTERPCGPLAEAARSVASTDIPALTVALIALAVLHGLRPARRRTRA